jgi:predicted DNA-binding transcriptional regulator YafY
MKPGAEARLNRILAMIPWIVAHDGPTVTAVCERFDCTPSDLARDIELLYLCGLHPFTPDLLIEAGIVDGRVFVQYAEYLSRPLRLTPAEGLALVASASTLLASPGTDPDGPLARGLAKLAKAIGSGDVEVDLGSVDNETLRFLQSAVDRPNQIEISYYAYGRDMTTIRVVEPASLFNSGGAWYLAAYCHLAHAERLFRVDRVLSATELETTRTQNQASIPTELRPGHGGYRVTLDIDSSAFWVREQYPLETVVTRPDGSMLVTILINEWPWLDRLLLRLGPAVRVFEAPPDWPGRITTAERIRRRYNST